MKRMKRAVNMIVVSIVTIGLTQIASITPAAAQNQCTLYANQVCRNYWDAMGYSSYGDCWQGEYARCVENGGPPDDYPYVGVAIRQTVNSG